MNQEFKVAVVLPVFNGGADLIRCLNSLEMQKNLDFDLLAVDSSSTDDSYDVLRSRAKHVIQIPTSEFNHGGTRQMMIDDYPGYDIYIFMTQDAYLEDENSLQHLIAPFHNPSVGVVCGRQLPHIDANIFSEHARIFNYPSVDRVSYISDKDANIKSIFVSNSFSAYRYKAVQEVKGFPCDVILCEDMYLAAKIIKNKWGVYYSASSLCRHSHNYSIIQEFKRYFDIGVFHSREPWIQKNFGTIKGEGFRYLKSEFKCIEIDKMYVLPEFIARNMAKYIGYKLGLVEGKIPIFVKKKISMHRRYWLHGLSRE